MQSLLRKSLEISDSFNLSSLFLIEGLLAILLEAENLEFKFGEANMWDKFDGVLVVEVLGFLISQRVEIWN